MSPSTSVRAACGPTRFGWRRELLRRISTGNPFYVLSALLFLAGLRLSFGEPPVRTPELMAGLAGYTLLLAVTACLLVRYAKVWDDARTVLLLVVLMFLATSVTFDEVLILTPGRGIACSLIGLSFAIGVSEAILGVTRLGLPLLFRGPYYLILALFFLYPVALQPLLDDPNSEALMWALYGFSGVAGLAFLTLLPAARRGAEYVSGNGSPWPWPLYPWALFGMLGLAVPARAFLLCWSMHLLDAGQGDRLIFGPYFLVPFGLAVAVLLLEGGIASGARGAVGAALALPAGFVVLSLVGHRADPIYLGFREPFAARLGGDPLFVTLFASAGFYAYAAVRRVPAATEALTVALAALAVVGPDSLTTGELVRPRAEPILAAAALQLVLGLRGHVAWRSLLGASGMVAGAALAVPEAPGVAAFHVGVFALLILGAELDDPLGRVLRLTGACLLTAACLVALFVPAGGEDSTPARWVAAYPLMGAAVLLAYGLLLSRRPELAMAALILTCWLGAAGWRGYCRVRESVAGLDYLAASLAVFAAAVLVSLAKAGIPGRWFDPRARKTLLGTSPSRGES